MVQRHSIVAAIFSLMLVVSGCASIGPAPPPGPSPQEPEPPPAPPPAANPNPAANVNLQGFPLPYRQGYADGCASVSGREQKDAARFRDDGQYRTGWQDGLALCKKR
jgi:hypothetical protein